MRRSGCSRTDIPRDLLEHLVPLAVKVKDAKITSLQFVPPVICTGNPDWAKIRRLTRRAIVESARSGRASQAAQAATPSPGAAPSGGTPAPQAGAATPSAAPGTQASTGGSSAAAQPRTAEPRRSPTPNEQAAQSINEACGLR